MINNDYDILIGATNKYIDRGEWATMTTEQKRERVANVELVSNLHAIRWARSGLTYYVQHMLDLIHPDERALILQAERQMKDAYDLVKTLILSMGGELPAYYIVAGYDEDRNSNNNPLEDLEL